MLQYSVYQIIAINNSYLLDNLLIAVSALVHYWVKAPHCPCTPALVFQFYLGFSPFNAVLLVRRNQVGKEKRIGSLGTIFRKNTDEKEVNDVGLMLLDGSQHMIPAERKQSATAALSAGHEPRTAS